MEEHPKEEMETINRNLENSEISITSSWVLLSTDEDPKVSEAKENVGADLATEKNEEQKAPLLVNVIQNVGDTNNKSDAESDGISIISESEFYQSRSDDDCSTNSSDENTVDKFRNSELPKSQYNNIDHLLELHENTVDVEVISNLPSLTNENDDIAHNITDSNIFKESSAGDIPESDKNNLEPTKYDKQFMKNESNNCFKAIVKYHFKCFIGSLILAITVSYISSKLTQNGSLDQRNMQQDDQNMVGNDEFISTRNYEYCGDTHECTSFNHDYNDEKYVRRTTRDMKKFKKLKRPGEQSKNLEPNIQETEINTSDKYDNNKNEEHMTCKSKKQPRHYNRNLENFWKLEKIQKKQPEITKEGLLLEKEELDIWRTNLMLEEKRLQKWESEMLEMAKLLVKKKNEYTFDGKSECKNKSKKEPKKSKNKQKFKNIDELRPDRSFEDKKYSKKYRNGDKKFNVPLNSHNQKSKRMKDKNDKYKRKIPADLKNFGELYIQKRNLSIAFDDNNAITGEWYLNLLRGRLEKREEGDKAGWWFDRANFRKIKRNKAYWYFQYMFNREDLRYHKNF